MSKATPLMNNFNAGELDPTIDARSDLEKYYSGCRVIENFMTQVEGGVQRVPGTYYLATAKEETVSSISASISPSVSPTESLSETFSISLTPSGSISASPSTTASVSPSISASVSPTPTPSTPSFPEDATWTKLDQIAPLSGDWYGTGVVGIPAGEYRYYLLPLDEVYSGQNINYLRVTSIASLDGRGDVSIRLISPDGSTFDVTSDGPFADEAVHVYGTSYPQGGNYPSAYLPMADWMLIVYAHINSSIRIWWKGYHY